MNLVRERNNLLWDQQKSDTFSICACHPCAGAMLIFSVSFQFFLVETPPKGVPAVVGHFSLIYSTNWEEYRTVSSHYGMSRKSNIHMIVPDEALHTYSGMCEGLGPLSP